MTYKAFICYRRDDWAFARSIGQKLAEEFGPDSVFLDVDDIRPSEDWKRRVEKVMSDEPVVLALITPKWNPRHRLQRKLMRSDDLVRLELEIALSKRLPIVPVHDESVQWPKRKEVPVSLASILDRNKVAISQTRFDYDAGVLVSAVSDLLKEAAKARKKRSKEPAPKPEADAPGLVTPSPSAFQKGDSVLFPPGSRLGSRTGIGTSTPFGARPTPVLPYSLANFRETPERKREREAILIARRERIERAKASAPRFYERWSFWLSTLVTFGLGAGALIGAEIATQAIADTWTTLPDPPLVMAILLILTWTLVRTGAAGFAYWSDPEEGAKVFYTRGIFGGYTLAIADYEPVGYWAAFPIATAFAWGAARGVAWLPFNYWGWSYSLVFTLVLIGITLPIAVSYLILTYDEVGTDYLMS